MVPLGVLRWTNTLGGGGGGDFHVWLTQYLPLCMVEVYTIFNLKKKYSVHRPHYNYIITDDEFFLPPSALTSQES